MRHPCYVLHQHNFVADVMTKKVDSNLPSSGGVHHKPNRELH